ncbi:MAG: glycosyltransferase [Firmicutes bacterium]|nr:glycosyltransferase [Bacillota bacterium]
MILSIGIIMKNEEKYLRDCLTAIKPVLDNVDSELIICDTGSTDNSINIAKEFTDNVLEIGWRNDFAWARQQGLQLCKGEWYWYIDADEVFQDVQEIVDFFNSGEYKNFGIGVISIDNNPKVKGAKRNLSKVVRLFKMVEGLQWHDKIHEQLLPYDGPAKYFVSSDCLHYGYVLGEEISKKKHKMKLKAVLEIYEERPHDYRNILHMISEYGDKIETQLKYAEIGADLAKKAELAENYTTDPCYYPAFAGILANIYLHFGEYTKVIDCVNEYFEIVPTKKISINASRLKYSQSLAFVKEEKFEEAKQAALESYRYKKLADNNELSIVALGAGVGESEVELNKLVAHLVGTFILVDKFDEAIEWLENALLQEDSLEHYESYATFVRLILGNNPKMLSDLYWHFVNNKNAKQQNDIITIIEAGIKFHKTKVDFARNLLKELKNPNIAETPYIKLQQLRVMLDENNAAAVDFLDYFMQQNELSQMYVDVLVVAIKYNKYFEELSQKLNIVSYVNLFNQTVDAINVLWQVVASNEKLLTLETVHKFLQQNNFMENSTNIKAVRFICSILSNLKNPKKNELLQFELVERMLHKYYKMIYSKNLYCENAITYLTESDKTTFYLGTAYEHKTAGNIADFAKYMRLALKTAPHYKENIQKITDNLQENLAPPTVHEQLQQEIANLKAVIYNMIETGNIAQAQQIFETYVQINPTDNDIPKIRQMLA